MIPVCLSMPPTHRLEVSLLPELCIQLLVVGSGQQRAVPSLPCDLGAQDKTGPGWIGCLGVRYVAEAQSLLIPSVGVRHWLVLAAWAGSAGQWTGPLSCRRGDETHRI